MAIEHAAAEKLSEQYQQVRSLSEKLASKLQDEDTIIQAMPDVSPPKWHLAHTTWFFERFILKEHDPSYVSYNEKFDYLFNSYYETIGSYHPRHSRGVLSRPLMDEVYKYRKHVDEAIVQLVDLYNDHLPQDIYDLIEIGLQHEQQHQELLLTDVKYNFSCNPLLPQFAESKSIPFPQTNTEKSYITIEGGLVEIGYSGADFSFDNERPRHKVWLEPYCLASHPVTNGEYLSFIEAGGYDQPEHWLSDGWSKVKQEEWKHPLYWRKADDGWYTFTLTGEKKLNLDEPVCHISFYEADAFARWSGKRLPTEGEWEHAMASIPIEGNFAESEYYHPCEDGSTTLVPFKQAYGDVWEWTSSPYTAYPKSKPLEGALGEYNAKFMCNQMVLRGGSCATSKSHIRPTYRNFFQADKRWQFSGLRLAEDLS
ncbi:ergothioneine biosynthesis protein EgtB [Fictibacillus phosphorivorans]|uniref:ergothioneine biosynthesis protein EgtB n=1 Tax=Fictibacillus phosphorivorans TaxID=1221500 RepID=UPI00203F6D62|nr:ergothioneine biosynthesis protein EgtB [Fictibacillus phosphorivorans]MCM3719065.1 ergothioneine biosynthesis protein EgtB [Fictibacillus phosphorivorans]MCM3776687.1 ergothioneine biosynthesis protein EgtB [Fictibacillus phosphorivorans]